ncbi:MAG: CBS domain-containing protein [Proteobacteria bacterium]|nr:CBS domain-containing protein [Pseudomonadota bacterium]MBU4296121.1 CBS domain-containing protein [Pseudomonadota bacterium]MCG2746730.1 CBS domain-containing protein [Desulfobulbaceae bacterium]
MEIKEVMTHIGKREVPCVPEHSDISEVIRVLIRFPHTRLVYVVDDRQRLRGSITVGSLLRHIFPYHYEARIHPLGILRNITAARAEHIMTRENVFALPEEKVDTVLKRMARTGAKEMAVVDQNGIIIGDITAIDLLSYYQVKTDSTEEQYKNVHGE